MKFASAITLLASTSMAAAATTFGIVTIHSGSSLQYASLYGKNGKDEIYVGSGDVTGSFTLDGGELTFNGHKLGLGKDSVVSYSGQNIVALKDFGISNEHLVYKGKETFVACPTGNQYVLSLGTCDNSIGVALRVTDSKDTTTSSTATTKPATSSTLVTKTTAKPTKTSTPVKGGCTFGAIAIHSGTNVQNQAIKKVDSHTQVFSVGGTEGKDVTFTLQSDGSLKDQDGRSIYVNPESGEVGDVDPWGAQQAAKTFTLNGDNLAFNGNTGFYACPSGKGYSLTSKSWNGCTGIVLHVVGKKNC